MSAPSPEAPSNNQADSSAPASGDSQADSPAVASGEGGNRILRRLAAALYYRDFRVLWFGACTSSIGTWMQTLAANWLVFTLTASPFFLGLDSFLQQFPIVLFTLIGGVIADRHDRRRTLLTSQAVQMFSALMLATLVFSGTAHISYILMLSFLTGCAQAFGGPAYQALIPTLVTRETVTNAVALNSIQFNIARLVGPLLAGGTIAVLMSQGVSEPSAMAACFALNGLSFLVVIMSLTALRVKHVPGPERRSMLQELQVGMSYVRQHRTILALILLSSMTTFLGFPLQTLLPVFAADIFGTGAEGLSYLMAFQATGAILGALVVAWRGSYRHMGLTTLVVLTVLGVLIAAFSLSRTPWLSYALLFGIGASTMIAASTLISLVQMIAPNEIRGRIMSIYLVAFRGGMPMGSLVGGSLASLVTAPVVLGVGGTLLSVVGIGFLLKSQRLRQL